MSLQNVREPDAQWPTIMGNDGATRELSVTEKCGAIGNKRRRNDVSVRATASVDTAWRSTPVKVWKEVIGELRDGFLYSPHYQSVEEGDIDSDVYGSEHAGCDSEETDPGELQQ